MHKTTSGVLKRGKGLCLLCGCTSQGFRVSGFQCFCHTSFLFCKVLALLWKVGFCLEFVELNKHRVCVRFFLLCIFFFVISRKENYLEATDVV